MYVQQEHAWNTHSTDMHSSSTWWACRTLFMSLHLKQVKPELIHVPEIYVPVNVFIFDEIKFSEEFEKVKLVTDTMWLLVLPLSYVSYCSYFHSAPFLSYSELTYLKPPAEFPLKLNSFPYFTVSAVRKKAAVMVEIMVLLKHSKLDFCLMKYRFSNRAASSYLYIFFYFKV